MSLNFFHRASGKQTFFDVYFELNLKNLNSYLATSITKCVSNKTVQNYAID